MALPIIPTKTDGSLGRVKTMRVSGFPQTPDLDHDLTPEELERIKDALIQMADVGSLGWEIVDDFASIITPIWLKTESNNGTVIVIDAATSPASSEGFGWIRLRTDSTSGSQAILTHKYELIRGAVNPILRARVKLPANFANATPAIRFAGQSLATVAALLVESGGFWQTSTKSNAGTGTQTVTTAVAATTSAIVDIRIEVETGVEVRFYVDDVLIQTNTQANAIPAAADIMAIDMRCTRIASSGGDFFVDWVDARSAR
jgi:hypothetical protein